MDPAFAVWITGLPASGKSTVASALVRELSRRGVEAAVLESDALRLFFSPRPTYTQEEREMFYAALAFVGAVLTRRGVPVIFDATANRRAYRDRARSLVPRFMEVFVDCPLDVCMGRDPKGIYRKARAGEASRVPGLQVPYEPPEHPDLIVAGDREPPERAARRIAEALEAKGFLRAQPVDA